MINRQNLAIGEKLNKVIGLINSDIKTVRDYGTGFSLPHSEVFLLWIISEYPNDNTSRLALRLGITKGAIAQVTKKLYEKGLITSFHTPENRKETFFKPTKLGKKAVSGHIRYHEQQSAQILEFINSLSGKEIKTINAFFDVLINSYSPK